MQILLLDNSKPECAIFTPKLLESLRRHGSVTACKTRAETIRAIQPARNYDAIVFSGSSLNMSDSLRTAAIAKDLMVLLRYPDVPCLGVCFGMQLIAVAYGGEVERMAEARVGELATTHNDFGARASREDVAFFSHQDVVVTAPPGFVVDGWCDGHVSMMHSDEFRRYGVQFHPECSEGRIAAILPDFLRRASGMSVAVTPALRLSPARFRAIAFDMGRRRPQEVASEHGLDRADVEHVWRRFRDAFRIPAVLL